MNVPRNRQRVHLARALVLLLLAGCWFASARVGAKATESTTPNKATPTVSDSVAIDMEVAAFGKEITNQLKAVGHGKEDGTAAGSLHSSVFIVSGALFVLLLVAVKFGPAVAGIFANQKSTAWVPAAMSPAEAAADEKVFAEFAAGFKVGPRAVSTTPAVIATASAQKPIESAGTPRQIAAATPAKPEQAQPPPPPPPLTRREFLEIAPKKIKHLRTCLQECSRITGLARQKILADLLAEVRSIKSGASDPSLLALWQLASAVEGLIKQLEEKPHNVTPSTLRTVAGGVDLFESLLSPIAGSELLSTPPIRFLAVDDDPISRHTISFALKRALTAPDLAENGPSGLALAEVNTYDVIFLDVQMPEMDGFEVCTKIHQTEANPTTPVVFVTCSSDFNSRATSTLVGGNDLIGKPFLTFEITVKALTLALRTRLAAAKARTVASRRPSAPVPTKSAEEEPVLATA